LRLIYEPRRRLVIPWTPDETLGITAVTMAAFLILGILGIFEARHARKSGRRP